MPKALILMMKRNKGRRQEAGGRGQGAEGRRQAGIKN
jgi:hypothetical protein